MPLTSTIIENYILEPGNMSRYELIYTTYLDHSCNVEMCSVTWLKRSRGGVTFVWQKGDSIYSSYALEKLDNVSKSDLAPILADIKKRYPGSIKELVGFEEYDENGCWRGQ